MQILNTAQWFQIGIVLHTMHAALWERIFLHFVPVLRPYHGGNIKAVQHTSCGIDYCWMLLARFIVRTGAKSRKKNGKTCKVEPNKVTVSEKINCTGIVRKMP